MFFFCLVLCYFHLNYNNVSTFSFHSLYFGFVNNLRVYSSLLDQALLITPETKNKFTIHKLMQNVGF